MQKTTIILLVGLLAGLAAGVLLVPYKNKQSIHNDAAKIIPAKSIVQTLQKGDVAYQFEKAKLLQQQHSLSNAYETIVQKLAKVKEENTKLQLRISNTVTKMHRKEDTIIYIAHCDTLQQQVTALSTGCHLQGMVSDSLITNLQEQVFVKENRITLADNRVKTMDSLLLKTLDQHQSLEIQLKQATRSKRKQKVWATIKTIAITGAAIWLGQKQ